MSFLDTGYWKFHCMYTNFCLKNLCCLRVRFEIGSYGCSYSLLLHNMISSVSGYCIAVGINVA